MAPWKLVEAHKYREAAKIYEQRLKKRPDNPPALDGHAHVMLCLGHPDVALDEFQRVNAWGSQDMTKLGGKSQPYLEHIGTAQWLSGRKADAIETFRSGAEGILNGSIEFGDLAGGASHGLLLWY